MLDWTVFGPALRAPTGMPAAFRMPSRRPRLRDGVREPQTAYAAARGIRLGIGNTCRPQKRRKAANRCEERGPLTAKVVNEPRRHHYVPQWYLQRFADSRGFLHVYDTHTKTWRMQRPNKIMRINDYYRQSWAPEGTDPVQLERFLGAELEPQGQQAIDKALLGTGSLDADESAALLTYLEFQWMRVPRQAQRVKARLRAFVLEQAPPDIREAVVSGRIGIHIEDFVRFDFFRDAMSSLSPYFMAMDWEVVESDGEMPFITTDSPVHFYNPEIPPPADAGVALAGTDVLFPLTPNRLLMMRHPAYDNGELEALDPITDLPEDVYIRVSRGRRMNREQVVRINYVMLKLSHRTAVANDRKSIAACLEFAATGRSPKEPAD
ncbi:DUF4238 domain-containing protein [Tahibacter aquaticus]|nr:DUF4238 domain-containing protein [Tahibacter aquaticus]